MSYHYTDSGLDEIFLENGYVEHETPYGKGVSIDDSAGLHRAIGRWLVERQAPLNGAGLRYVRLELELTQRDLAGIIGATEQTLRLWEKHRDKDLPGPPDRLVRALFSETLGDDHALRHLLKRLASSERIERDRACFRRTAGAWTQHEVETADRQLNPAVQSV